MLISHQKKFVFTKTKKTAGTSVESLFEPYCMEPGTWKKVHHTTERISEYGVVGYRGESGDKAYWWNHLSAAIIRERIGESVWDEYFKFTVIRNPFDKLISGFHMIEARQLDCSLGQKIKLKVKKFLGRGRPQDHIAGETEIERFRSWLRLGGSITDRDCYMIDGEVCIDYFIRFEDLANGIEHVYEHLEIDSSAYQIPEFKSGYRNSQVPIKDYYDEETEAIVRERFGWELRYFGYDLPK
jgi:hypothetical protein